MQRTHSLILPTSGHDDVHVEPLRGEELHAYIPLRLACLKRVVDTRHIVVLNGFWMRLFPRTLPFVSVFFWTPPLVPFRKPSKFF